MISQSRPISSGKLDLICSNKCFYSFMSLFLSVGRAFYERHLFDAPRKSTQNLHDRSIFPTLIATSVQDELSMIVFSVHCTPYFYFPAMTSSMASGIIKILLSFHHVTLFLVNQAYTPFSDLN